MNAKALIVGVAVAGLAAGSAEAAKTRHHARAESAGAYAEPAQPVAYANLNTYLKASPRQRTSRDWSTAAATGASVNSSATMPAASSAPMAPAPAAPDTTSGATANTNAPAATAPTDNSANPSGPAATSAPPPSSPTPPAQ